MVTITGGQIKTVGGYVAIGSTQAVTAVTVVSTAGQCLGILCGVTKAN